MVGCRRVSRKMRRRRLLVRRCGDGLPGRQRWSECHLAAVRRVVSGLGMALRVSRCWRSTPVLVNLRLVVLCSSFGVAPEIGKLELRAWHALAQHSYHENSLGSKTT